MRSTKTLVILILASALGVCGPKPTAAMPMGTAITYQGRLIDANDAADGLYDFQFKLYDANNDGNQIGSDVNKADVDVIEGYFTVELDYNNPGVFNGDARWLEIGVRPGEMNDPNVYTTLSPRQEITPTPYALQTRGIFVDDYVTLVGIDAGHNNQGKTNTFVGRRAGYSNTTGWGNSAIGYRTLQDNTTGFLNLAVGDSALRSNTTGYFNSAAGSRILVSNTTGKCNSAMGYQALQHSTTGFGNSAMGAYALRLMQTGLYNTAVGYQAGYSSSGNSFSNNSLFGYRAGYALTTGGNNILIGYQAGDSITTGTDNIIIGYNEDTPAADTNDFLNIGGTIYGDLNTGKVGIGTTSPGHELAVAGNIESTNGIKTPLHFEWSGKTGFFANGVSDLVAYIDFGNISMRGWVEVTLTGANYFQRTSGRYTKRYEIYRGIGSHIYKQSTEVPASFGDVATQWKLGNFEIDANDHIRIPIYHVVSTGNTISVFIEGEFYHSKEIDYALNNLTLTAPAVVANSETRDYASIMATRVGIGTTSPAYKLDVEGDVQAHAYHTGDIFFQKDGEKLWRMFEDEDGLYLENLKTGKIYSFVLQETKSIHDVNGAIGLGPIIKELKAENEALKQRLEALEKTIQQQFTPAKEVQR